MHRPFFFLLLLGCDLETAGPLHPTAGTPTPCEAGAVGWLETPGGKTRWPTVSPWSTLTLTEPGTFTLCPGTHTVELLVEAPVVITGAGVATLSGAGALTPIHIGSHADTVTIEDLTLTDGLATHRSGGGVTAGGAIFCDTPAELALNRLHLLNNEAELGGGGHFGSGCTVTLTDTTLEGNRADEGAALSLFSASGLLQGVAIHGNEGDTILTARDADLLQLFDTSLSSDLSTVAAVAVSDTTALALWGVDIAAQPAPGLLLSGVDHTLIGESLFLRNAGGIIGEASGALRVFESTFEGNEAAYPGGAIASDFTEATLSSTAFHHNSAPYGDAIALSAGSLSGQSVDFNRQPDDDLFLLATGTDHRLPADFSCTPLTCTE